MCKTKSMIIAPTSVEAERVFSAGGLFLTKLRSGMSDSTLVKLMFLKSFFALSLKKENVFRGCSDITFLFMYYRVRQKT